MVEIWHTDWDLIDDKQVQKRICCTNHELCDLDRCQKFLQSLRNMNFERRAEVERVLLAISDVGAQVKGKLTIRAWMPELTKTNIHMGGDM